VKIGEGGTPLQEAAVARLDALSQAELRLLLAPCCGSKGWLDYLVSRRPYRSASRFFAMTERAADGMEPEDWLEAFKHHPRIGDLASLRAKYTVAAGSGPSQHERWAQGEQSAVGGADDGVLEALAAGNERYEQRFGFRYIVCATGKSAAEMLGLLRARLSNDRGSELAIAAGEQRKITQLRLEKLLASLAEEAS
jgi:2-oxo-4-hydroxy-4-carboxy-5-ureidoimidazoline decarboxylase